MRVEGGSVGWRLESRPGKQPGFPSRLCLSCWIPESLHGLLPTSTCWILENRAWQFIERLRTKKCERRGGHQNHPLPALMSRRMQPPASRHLEVVQAPQISSLFPQQHPDEYIPTQCPSSVWASCWEKDRFGRAGWPG